MKKVKVMLTPEMREKIRDVMRQRQGSGELPELSNARLNRIVGRTTGIHLSESTIRKLRYELGFGRSVLPSPMGRTELNTVSAPNMDTKTIPSLQLMEIVKLLPPLIKEKYGERATFEIVISFPQEVRL